MTFRRLAAIALIFLATAFAWTVLGSSLVARTGQFDTKLEQDVERLWGAPQRQIAPSASIGRPGTEVALEEARDANGKITRTEVTRQVVHHAPAALESSAVNVQLALEHRQRGLLWYPTYTVDFQGTYVFRNPDNVVRELRVQLPLPAEGAVYDNFALSIDGTAAAQGGDISKEIRAAAPVQGNASARVEVRYRSRGLRSWTYALAPTGVAQVRNFGLTMQTNFTDVDFPAGTMSPTTKVAASGGWTLTWAFSNLISGQDIGMAMPQKLNPGPFAARVTFFAPASLLFFLAVMVILGATRGTALHPMHYWFIAAAFFAFHLLLAYLVDHITVHLAFLIAAVVSMGLVFTYLRIVCGTRQALLVAVPAQAIFLVLFSYAFFFEGFTGLTITVGAIVTLFVLMQMTARVSWDDIFSGGPLVPPLSLSAGGRADAFRS
jgi:inner membrane protein involved in colicin E2 resistance